MHAGRPGRQWPGRCGNPFIHSATLGGRLAQRSRGIAVVPRYAVRTTRHAQGPGVTPAPCPSASERLSMSRLEWCTKPKRLLSCPKSAGHPTMTEMSSNSYRAVEPSTSVTTSVLSELRPGCAAAARPARRRASTPCRRTCHTPTARARATTSIAPAADTDATSAVLCAAGVGLAPITGCGGGGGGRGGSAESPAAGAGAVVCDGAVRDGKGATKKASLRCQQPYS